MNIHIPDDLPAKKRKEILTVYPTVYAMKHCKENMHAAAAFLGIDKRTFVDRLIKFDMLKGFRRKKYFKENDINRDDIDSMNRDPLAKIYRFHLNTTMKSFWWNTCSQEDKDAFLKRLDMLYKDITPKKTSP